MKKIFLPLLLFSISFYSVLPWCRIYAEEVRKPAVAGQFYPADPKELSQQIEQFLLNVKKEEIPVLRSTT
ncbi:MAG TPA: hypothetical protein DHV62_08115, partial [Elusimicrobia bacterium]|nr:hypothetical protein [Elusimicrobiota bacterium]